ncbi:DedA family protein [Acidisoma sp. C75]
MILPPATAQALGTYGYGFVAFAIGVESLGIPFPGEATLLAAALYAGATHHLDIGLVVAAAALGAILGDNIGAWLGRRFGFPLLLRFGRHVRMTPPRIKLGQYLFLHYGCGLVFFGRFVSLLRTFAAFLAGANRMPWPQFLICNAAGGIVWASLYGFGAYTLGHAAQRLLGPLGIALGAAALIGILLGGRFLRKHERALQAKAEAAFPGPIEATRTPPPAA